MEPEIHVGENAELYALGALDEAEAAQVEAHIADCTACERRVGEAEETLLALERGSKVVPESPAAKVLPFARRKASLWWIAPAIAAAFIVGMLVPRPAPQRNPAMLAMIHSHFSHAQFSGAVGVPAAKVIYARDRSWYYVIVEGKHRYDVYGLRGAQATPLGATEPNGATSELFSTVPKRFDRLELREAGAPLEGAALR